MLSAFMQEEKRLLWGIFCTAGPEVLRREISSLSVCVGTSSKLPMFTVEMLGGTKRKRWRVSGRCILLKEIINSKAYLKMRISIIK